MRYIRFKFGQSSGSYFLICVLKVLASSITLNVFGTKFHILGLKLNKLSDP